MLAKRAARQNRWRPAVRAHGALGTDEVLVEQIQIAALSCFAEGASLSFRMMRELQKYNYQGLTNTWNDDKNLEEL